MPNVVQQAPAEKPGIRETWSLAIGFVFRAIGIADRGLTGVEQLADTVVVLTNTCRNMAIDFDEEEAYVREQKRAQRDQQRIAAEKPILED